LHHKHIMHVVDKGPVIRATFSCNLSRNNVAVASWDCLLRVLPPSRATNFHIAGSRCRFYFLQHKNLLREKVVIRATNNLNLQWQHCCSTSCTKMLPILLGFKGIFETENNTNFLHFQAQGWSKLRISFLLGILVKRNLKPYFFRNFLLEKIIYHKFYLLFNTVEFLRSTTRVRLFWCVFRFLVVLFPKILCCERCSFRYQPFFWELHASVVSFSFSVFTAKLFRRNTIFKTQNTTTTTDENL